MLMKKLISTLVIIGCAFSTYAQEYKFVAAGPGLATKLCVHAANNNRAGVKHVMKMLYDNRSTTLVANTMRCNDLSIAQFAHKYEAKDTFKYLNRMSHGENRLNTSTHIRDIVLLSNDQIKEPVTVYVLAKL